MRKRYRHASGRAAAAAAVALSAVVVAASPASMADASQTARLTAKLTPEKLGSPTALSLGVDIASAGGGLPSALTGIDFNYPRGLAFATSSLGLATCSQPRLEVEGPSGCPADSRMGGGSAVVEFPLGPETREETAHIAMVAAPSSDGLLHVLIYANGEEPVYGQIVMSAVLLHGDLHFTVPLVPSLPNSPDVAVVRLRVTIGGDLTYEERIRGRIVTFRPKGIGLPSRCPHGGFRFAATFSFLDGSRTAAQTAVRCPRRRRR